MERQEPENPLACRSFSAHSGLWRLLTMDPVVGNHRGAGAGKCIMSIAPTCDEDLLRRLPLPLAQLYRRAHNTKTSLERHLTAYYVWEAALKLLASVSVVSYLERGEPDAKLSERLTNLARPALGHWWEFVRLLVPMLAESDANFAAVRDLLFGRAREDFPRAAGLDAELRETLDGAAGTRSTVRLSDLFERLLRHRNREMGHGAAGQHASDFYRRMGQALLTGMAELLNRVDVLVQRRLIYVADVRRQASGAWLMERYELVGESARRIESLEVPETDASRLPLPERVYLECPVEGPDTSSLARLQSLHPLLVYDGDTGEVLFLNARRGQKGTEYLCYSTGRGAAIARIQSGDEAEPGARARNRTVVALSRSGAGGSG